MRNILLGFLTAAALCSAATSAASARDLVLAQAQVNLLLLGYQPGPLDGSWGSRTQTAFEQFYAKRGGTFDNKFSINEVDDLYSALSEIPLNGAGLDGFMSAKVAKTASDPAFDFLPPRDLAAELPKITKIIPFDQFSARIRTGEPLARNHLCGWPDEQSFPAKGKQLTTYASLREFETVGNRIPNHGNDWFDDLKSTILVAASHIAANPDRQVVAGLHDALLRYAKDGVGLDSVNLLDKQTGKVIVTPDLSTGIMVSTSLTLSYLLVKPRLKYTAEEAAQVEQWLDRLFETFGDSYIALNGDGTKRDPRGIDLVGRATMANAMLKNDPEMFNRGAQMSATFISFVRADGSSRGGASRGFRALYYSGLALDMALEDLLIMESQGLPARQLLLPTINRMADFSNRAFADNSVLWPYARENVAVTVGSDYKKQDEIQAPNSLDMFFALSPDEPSVPGLREVRKLNQYDTQLTESFAGTCMAIGLAAPLDAYATAQAAAAAAPKLVLDQGEVSVSLTDDLDSFTQYRVSLRNAKYNGKGFYVTPFDVLTDYASGAKTAQSLHLIRIGVETKNLLDAESRNADYADCGPLAMRESGPNLHYGGEGVLNECVLGHMSPRDAQTWTLILNSLPTMLHADASQSAAATNLDMLITVKPLPEPEE